MFRCGLLLLSNRLPVISSNIASILDSALQHVSDCLYIHIAPEGCLQATQSDMPEPHIPTTTGIKQFVTEVYISTTKYARKTDVRLLLNNFSVEGCQPSSPYRLKQACDVVLLAGVEDASLHERAVSYASQAFPDSLLSNISTKSLPVKLPSDVKSDNGGDEHCKIYEHICLGGTFDRLHNGHKLLLSQGVLLCTGSLTVGVTDGDMNKRKVLGELMEPTSKRIAAVLDFVQDIKPSLQYKVVPITDPYGPAIVDGSLQCIVVSPETLRGAHAVNTKREQADLSQLDVELIDILPESQPTEADAEEKMSSSNQRIRLLGTLLDSSKCTPRQSASKLYVIGLTGGIASGKSSVCQRLQALGAAIIDCDKLGHQTYQKGTKTWNDVISTFGRDVLKEDGEIDRRALGGKVFADKSELEKLNGIVWPAIADLVKAEIDRLQSLGKEVIVLDAAVLLEAGWDKSCQEVWVCIVPVEEATKRLMERNNLTEAQATQRISSQLSNQERVNRASVVLSTLWEPQVTQKQVEKAWRLLLSRVSSPSADQL